MKIRFLSILCVMGMLLALPVQACLCGPNSCPPCWDAIIEGFPVIDGPSAAAQAGKVGEDAVAAVGTGIKKGVKQQILSAKSQLLSSLNFPVNVPVLEPAITKANTFTTGLTDTVFTSGENMLGLNDGGTGGASGKGNAGGGSSIANTMAQVEKNQINTNNTLAGIIYERERRAYMRQENAIDAYAKALLVRQNLADTIELMGDKLLEDNIKAAEDINGALRYNMVAATTLNQLLSLYQQVLSARAQLGAAKQLDNLGSVAKPVIQGSI